MKRPILTYIIYTIVLAAIVSVIGNEFLIRWFFG
jgi:hypothetical protein